MSEHRDNCSKDAGEEKIREFVKNSTRVYANEFEPFLRFTSINAVRDKLAEFKKKQSATSANSTDRSFWKPRLHSRKRTRAHSFVGATMFSSRKE